MPIHSVRFLLVLPLLAICAAPSAAQDAPAPPSCFGLHPAPVPHAGARADYLRVAEVAGVVSMDIAGLVRPSTRTASSRCLSPDSLLWAPGSPVSGAGGAAVLPARVRFTSNSAYPRDRNNGALWAGRGRAVSVEAGVAYARGGFRAAIAPAFTWSENLSFPVIPVADSAFSTLAHPWHHRGIDWPQRFGTGSVALLHPGDSYVRYDAARLSVGLSTENLWVGPARRNPVLMSNTAPGFPHLFAGSRGPIASRIGGFDVQLATGLLGESEYWDREPDNDRRLITVATLTYAPRWTPGLSLGLGRVYSEILEPGRLPLDRVLLNLVDVPLVDVVSSEGGNEITSVFARWVFPSAGFEAYGEWAREEDARSLADFLSEPDYTQGYVLGAQKVVTGDRRWWRLWGELTHLGPTTPVLRGLAGAPYYTSLAGGQGHTHRGQLLGAWIGPGSDTQALGLDLFHRLGMIGLYGERVRFDDDTYYETWARAYGEVRHDVEVTGGFRTALNARAFEAALEVAWSLRYDRHFLVLDGANRDRFEEENRMVELVVTFRP